MASMDRLDAVCWQGYSLSVWMLDPEFFAELVCLIDVEA
jgi:hypothetical protein